VETSRRLITNTLGQGLELIHELKQVLVNNCSLPTVQHCLFPVHCYMKTLLNQPQHDDDDDDEHIYNLLSSFTCCYEQRDVMIKYQDVFSVIHEIKTSVCMKLKTAGKQGCEL